MFSREKPEEVKRKEHGRYDDSVSLQSVDHVLPLTLYGTFITREISLKCNKNEVVHMIFERNIETRSIFVKYFYSIEKVRKTFEQIHFGQFTFGNRIDQKRIHETFIFVGILLC